MARLLGRILERLEEPSAGGRRHQAAYLVPPLDEEITYPINSEESLYRLDEVVRESKPASDQLVRFGLHNCSSDVILFGFMLEINSFLPSFAVCIAYLSREVDDMSVAHSVAGVVGALMLDDVVKLFNFQGRNGKIPLRRLIPTLLNLMIGEYSV